METWMHVAVVLLAINGVALAVTVTRMGRVLESMGHELDAINERLGL